VYIHVLARGSDRTRCDRSREGGGGVLGMLF
jgi:hypothetical protein